MQADLLLPGDASTADRAFVHSRLIDASQARVFRAFSDPAHLARWWGANGKDYPNESGFREIAAQRNRIARLVHQTNAQHLDRLAAEVRNVA